MVDPLGGPDYWWPFVAAFLVGYGLGSVPFGLLLTRWSGAGDIRRIGSGNIGATNVLRTGRKGLALATLLLDLAKGGLPTALGHAWFGPDVAVLAGAGAILGHCFPVWLGFKGGKGVATAAGVLLGINPWLGLATLLTWLIIAAFFRYSSLASIVSAVFAPFYQLLIWGGGPTAIAITVMGLLLIWRHTGNIRKLLEGTESKLGQKAHAAAAPAHPVHPPHAATAARHHGHERGHRKGAK